MYELKGVLKRRKTSEYAQIHNKPLQELDMEPAGMLAYCMSLPDTWTLRKAHLQKKYSRRRADKAWKVLAQEGYLIGFAAYYYSKGKQRILKDSFYMVSDLPFSQSELHEFILEVKEQMAAHGDELKRVKDIEDAAIKIEPNFCNAQNVHYGETQEKQGFSRNVQNEQYGANSTGITSIKEIKKKEIGFKEISLKEEEEEGAQAPIVHFLMTKDISQQNAAAFAGRVIEKNLQGYSQEDILLALAKAFSDYEQGKIDQPYLVAARNLELILDSRKKKPNKRGSANRKLRVEALPGWFDSYKEAAAAAEQTETDEELTEEELKRMLGRS